MTFEPLTPERRRADHSTHPRRRRIVFARNEFHGSTLDEVAATAGFSKGAVYSNFKSKDDLFVALLDDRIERQFAVVSEVLDTGHDAAEQFPRIREIFRSDMFWVTTSSPSGSSSSSTPGGIPKPSGSWRPACRTRVQQLIEHEYAMVGASPVPDE